MALRVAATRDLLFGLLALQVGLIEQGDLFAAFNAWSRGKEKALSDLLVAQGSLDLEQRGLIDSLVAMHLKRPGDDSEKSLVALGTKSALRARLIELGDPDLIPHATTSETSSEPWGSGVIVNEALLLFGQLHPKPRRGVPACVSTRSR
jgi:hypothetical protein